MCNDFILRNVQNEELSYGEATGTEPTLLTSTGHILYLEGEKLQTLSLMLNFEEAGRSDTTVSCKIIHQVVTFNNFSSKCLKQVALTALCSL